MRTGAARESLHRLKDAGVRDDVFTRTCDLAVRPRSMMDSS